jgi:hypothetical protein
VLVAIQEVLETLPQKYSDDDYRVKCDAVYQHVYDSYYGAGRSVYAVARWFSNFTIASTSNHESGRMPGGGVYDTRRSAADVTRGLRGLS